MSDKSETKSIKRSKEQRIGSTQSQAKVSRKSLIKSAPSSSTAVPKVSASESQTASTGDAVSIPSKAAHKKSPKPRRKITKYDILFTLFVLLWAPLVLVASQYVAYYLVILLSNMLSMFSFAISNFTMLIYYIMSYALALPLIIFIPPRFAKYLRKHLESQTPKEITADLAASRTDLGLQHLPTFVDIGLAPIAYIISIFLASVFTSFMSNFAWFNADQAQDVGFGYFVTDFDRLFAILGVVIIAPIVEEIIMRGWLYGKLRRKWAAPVATILVSLIFAVLHGQWNVGVSVFALSLVLCTLREITGTIWSGILLHMLSNGIAFYITYIAL